MMRAEYLDMSKIVRDEHILWIFRAVDDHGGTLRFVGGAVRDALAGISGSTPDLVTDLSPDELVEACQESGLKTAPLGLKLDTIGVVLNDQILKVATLRKNVVDESGKKEVMFSDDWSVDASRRDLTINAVYADLKGNVFDYYNGISDLEKGIVRFIGNPEDRIKEDYLRIMRFFRFYGIFGKGDADTKSLQACIKLKSGLRSEPIERVRDELFKILVVPNAARVVKLLFDNEILDYFLPKPKNFAALKNLSDIISDINYRGNFLRRLFVMYQPNVSTAENIADNLRFTKKQKEAFVSWAKIEMNFDNIVTADERKKYIYRYGKQFCIDKILISCAIKKLKPINLPQILAEIESTVIPVFPVRGRDIVELGVSPKSKKIGNILAELERKWVESNFSLSRDEMINMAKTSL